MKKKNCQVAQCACIYAFFLSALFTGKNFPAGKPMRNPAVSLRDVPGGLLCRLPGCFGCAGVFVRVVLLQEEFPCGFAFRQRFAGPETEDAEIFGQFARDGDQTHGFFRRIPFFHCIACTAEEAGSGFFRIFLGKGIGVGIQPVPEEFPQPFIIACSFCHKFMLCVKSGKM